MPLHANKVAELKLKLEQLRAGTKINLQRVVNEIKADIRGTPTGTNAADEAQMAELMAYAVNLIDNTLGVPHDESQPRTRRRMSQVSDVNPIQPLLGAATLCEQYFKVTLDDVTNSLVYAPKDGVKIGQMITEFDNLLDARVNSPDFKLTGGNPPPPPPPPPEDEEEKQQDDDDTVAPGRTAVSIVSAEIDADILNRRRAKVFAKNPAKRLFDQKESGYEDQPIDVVETLAVLISKFDKLKDPNQADELMSKTEDASYYKGLVRTQNFADIAEIYRDRVQWIYDEHTRADQLHVTAKNAANGYDTVATLTLTADSATLILDSDTVTPAIARTKATNRQAAGRSLQELLLQTSSLINQYSEVTPKFMHVYTPNTSGNPISSSSKIDVESLVNTCMTVVLASQNIPTFDDQTIQAFRDYNNSLTGKQEVKDQLGLLYQITQAAKSGTSADKLNALEIYNEYMSGGPDDPYAAKAKDGINDTRFTL